MKLLLVASACLVVLLAAGCGRHRPPPVAAGPHPRASVDDVEPIAVETADSDGIRYEAETAPLDPIDIVPLPVERTDAPPSDADLAEAAFAAGRLDEAVAAYEALLGREPEGPDADTARFRLGLIYAGPSTPYFNIGRALQLLGKMGSSPDGTHAAEAGLVVELLLRLRQLQEDAESSREEARRISHELERLKAIDQERRRGGLP